MFGLTVNGIFINVYMWVCNVQIYKFFISNKPHRCTHDIILSVCQIFYGVLTNLDISKCWDWLGYDI